MGAGIHIGNFWFLTDTFLGASVTPWEAYDQELSRLERVIVTGRDEEIRDASEEDREKTERYYASLENLISNAKKPIWKVAYISSLLIIAFIVAIGMTMFSIGFSRKVARELLKTESLLLINSALLLGMVVSSLLFGLAIVVLFTLTSGFLLHVPSFASILLTKSSLLGAGVVAGYSFLAWYVSPIWIKAAAAAAIVPTMLLVIAGILSGAMYPVRHRLGPAICNLIARALESKNGALAFFATGMGLLAAAITLAVSVFVT